MHNSIDTFEQTECGHQMNAKRKTDPPVPIQMRRDCSISKSMDIFGDRWSILILREMFLGTKRFADFQRNLGIAKNILSNRLQKLEDHGIIAKRPLNAETSWNDYLPTDAGKDLLTILCAMVQWGDRWVQGPDGPPMDIIDRQTKKPIDSLALARKGKTINGDDIQFRPGARYDSAKK